MISDKALRDLRQQLHAELRREPAGLPEHRLLSEFSDHSAFADLQSSAELNLFQRHFLLMNCLYRLRDELRRAGKHDLEISPLCIRLREHAPADSQSLREASAELLREYYLNWDNFCQTGADDVAALLGGFWQRFHKLEGRGEALAVLGLEPEADPELIEQRYRQLAARHHPDKGGEPGEFMRIREAWELLKP